MLVLALATVVPIHRVGDLQVAQSRLIGAGDTARIAVAFSTAEDLAALQRRLNIGYIAAKLSACDDGDAMRLEPIAQRAEYLGDHGRVRAFGSNAASGEARFRYQATFDRPSQASSDGRSRVLSPGEAPGGLCFSLHGASMWGAGLLWSNKVRLLVR